MNVLGAIITMSILVAIFTGRLGNSENDPGMGEMNEATSETQLLTDLKPGKWGGVGAVFAIESEGSTILLDCGEVVVDQSRIRINRSGKFSATGKLRRNGPGPIRPEFSPPPQAVTLAGKIAGNRMTVTLEIKDTKEPIGTFVLELGAEGRVRACR